MTIASRIRARRKQKPFIHAVPFDMLVVWTNVGWRHIGTDQYSRAKIKWQGGEPEIPVVFDPEIARILQARGDLDDKEGVAS